MPNKQCLSRGFHSRCGQLIQTLKKGYLNCKLKEDEAQKAQVAFKTLEIALLDLESQFAKYLKLEVKDEVN